MSHQAHQDLWNKFVIFAACRTEMDKDLDGVRRQVANPAVDFYATMEGMPESDTKVYADENMHVLWNADDRINIFNKIT